MNKPIPFGKYYLLERINVGGMAEVFRAKHFGVEGFERLVAVKRILPNIAEDKEFIEMFVEEAKISVQLTHANIAQVFDLGHEEGSYYIALEHIHGRDLRAVFDRNRSQGEPMPVPQACFVIMKVCEGLDYAHNKRDESGRELDLVHRDVSPQNVIVSHEGEVKLIDFGIAKAAGRGSQTQAGILKGKFGYMSPEQVRGLPVDRRSDVFSCGIVLYELLTGERLFIGESDFSTLEKVRNVEILPPSTYNRKIQPELERIVLKALSKDVEERYQNAIDLHDELQAFVYTSGEFYSRKDLASWMKKQWAKEIKEESAKLAQYRDMAPPAAALATTSTPPGAREGRAHGHSSRNSHHPARKSNPPPIPGALVTGPTTSMRAADDTRVERSDLAWDEDELETSIYDEDGPGEDVADPDSGVVLGDVTTDPLAMTALAASTLTVSPVSDSALAAPDSAGEPVGATTPSPDEPDLSTLAATSQGWTAPDRVAPNTEGASGSNRHSGASHDQELGRGRVADGSNRGRNPGEPSPSSSSVSEQDFPSAEISFADSSMAGNDSFPADLLQPSIRPSGRPSGRPKYLLYALIATSILIFGAIVLVRSMGPNTSASEVASESGHNTSASTTEQGSQIPSPSTGTILKRSGVANSETGFDLLVDPSGVKVSLNGSYIGKAPLQIRGLRPGEHSIEIEAPTGFFSKSETVTVEQDHAERVHIMLDVIAITAKFKSDPTGAEVLLVTDGESKSIGNAPVEHRIDPRAKYQVIFRRAGYESITKPVTLIEGTTINVMATLTKSKAVSRPKPEASLVHKGGPTPQEHQPGQGNEAGNKEGPAQEVVVVPNPKPAVEVTEDLPIAPKPRPKPIPVSNAMGTLLLGAKPPCKIFIDGRDIGKMTPQRGIKLPVGKHRITLLNNALGIKESFNVKISAGKATKALKDYTGQIR